MKQAELFKGSSPTLQGTRARALELLADFLPRAGRDYQNNRNLDRGRDGHSFVSRLSPFVRHRILSEEELISNVLSSHSRSAAFKFIQEIFWRTYWKGWLEHRPVVWDRFEVEVQSEFAKLKQVPVKNKIFEQAIGGSTEIAIFNSWVNELKETGYLHNHARMWFASIWIFTLRLPWQLGADFFYNHLLDGDPASNTLGWRWVAGLQTAGKTYLATESNIRKNAAQRLKTIPDSERGLERLATQTFEIEDSLTIEEKAPSSSRFVDLSPVGIEENDAVLVTVEDLSTQWLDRAGNHVAIFEKTDGRHSEIKKKFRQEAIEEVKYRIAENSSVGIENIKIFESAHEISSWMEEQGLNDLHSSYIPTGEIRSSLAELPTMLESSGHCYYEHLNDYDRTVWPHCRKGFFQLGKSIDSLIDTLGLDG
tara:strand:+ start:390 stop:1658 length:1269 start_codon:yes stop_codon:yes gene_type:complete